MTDKKYMRIFALSDIHIDFNENQRWVNNLSDTDFKNDVLILAGDICHNLEKLKNNLLNLRGKFTAMTFVPGNHDLWVRGEHWKNSIEKFDDIIGFCRDNDITVQPQKFGQVWMVPLFSWYTEPADGEDSLYWPKPGEDKSNRMWSDRYFVKWPAGDNGFSASRYFFERNREMLDGTYEGTVISASHFIPRKEMMFHEYPPKIDPEKIKKYDRNPGFNFSRVAGSSLIEEQIRIVGAQIHVYGHQHINRDREIDGVRYVAHCLGYPSERRRGTIRGIEEGIKQIWPDE